MDKAFLDVLDLHRKGAPDVIRPTPGFPEGGDLTAFEVGNRSKDDPLFVIIPDPHYAVAFMVEELTELLQAYRDRDLAGLADAHVDLIYVTVRSAIVHGIDLRPLWRAIHANNMQKVGLPRDAAGKIVKPPGFPVPDIAGLLARQELIA